MHWIMRPFPPQEKLEKVRIDVCVRDIVWITHRISNQTTVRRESHPRKEGRMEISNVWRQSVKRDSLPGLIRHVTGSQGHNKWLLAQICTLGLSHPPSCWKCGSHWL